MKKVKVFLLAMSLMLTGGCTLNKQEIASNLPTQAVNISVPENIPLAIEEKEITISYVGDCTLGEDRDKFGYARTFDAKYDEVNDPLYFLSKVRDIFLSDDFTLVNLEGPLTLSNEKCTLEKIWHFKGNPQYAYILSLGGVDAVNLANNHLSLDYGETGYNDTIKALEDANVKYFGNNVVLIEEIKGIKFGFVGVRSMSSYELMDGVNIDNQVSDEELIFEKPKAELNDAFDYLNKNNIDVKIVYFHWGNEREEMYNDAQRYMGRYAIDLGADFVWGSHPHILQGVEQYNGKYIVYSLGNFLYGGHKNPKDYDTAICQTTFVFKNGKLDDIKLNMIPCLVSSSIGKNDYCPYALEGEEKNKVLDKIELRNR